MKLASSAVASELLGKAGVSFESQSELIPTTESIKAVFDALLADRIHKERRKFEDKLGTYLWEVEFEVEGGTVEFNYMRKGRYEKGGSASATKIHVVYFDEDGMPDGGEDIAEFVNGTWEKR